MVSGGGLDVVVRFHGGARVAELDRCLFSLVMQDYAPLTVHLVLQRFEEAARQALAAALADTLSLNPDVVVRVHGVDAAGDARAALLNAGLAAATGRFLAILDYDDVIQAGGYRALAAELAGTGAAIAFGGIAAKFVSVSPHASVMRDRRLQFTGQGLANLFHDNFCPIHSFMLDRSKIDPPDLRFDESLRALEDYDLLLRVCAKYRASFRLLGTVVGDYYFKDDGSNTTPIGASASPEKLAAWDTARTELVARKARIPVSLEVQRAMGVSDPAPGRTVAELARAP